MSQTAPQGASALHSLAQFDDRSFFEKALAHGLAHGLIDTTKLDAIALEAPKGMVQIARYFGSEFLRPELEKARERLVNLVSLALEIHSDGDLHQAAVALREHSLLSRSKAGADLLKALIAMPQSSHFGMHESGGFTDEHIPQLAKWSLRSAADYRAELAKRQQVANVVDAALHLAEALGTDRDDLDDSGRDAEAVIRTALLALSLGHTQMPDWVAFEKMVQQLRKKFTGGTTGRSTGKAAARKTVDAAARSVALPLPKSLPARLHASVDAVRLSVESDLPKIFESALPARKLFDQTPAFMGRYFWVEDALNEVDHFERAASAVWHKATGGHSDDSSLLTLFLCVAAGGPHKTLLSAQGAAALVRKLRKNGLQAQAAQAFIADHAPDTHRSDYLEMWQAFLLDLEPLLASDHRSAPNDTLSLLRRECNVAD
ncbi:hypothetical protein [Rhodoferax sp.]|uniref:hypothetical protein n=1 Tax=Rhodoferax sp. TaxID=50421 RepID=UPI003783586D